jgi:hypothetical protein
VAVTKYFCHSPEEKGRFLKEGGQRQEFMRSRNERRRRSLCAELRSGRANDFNDTVKKWCLSFSR